MNKYNFCNGKIFPLGGFCSPGECETENGIVSSINDEVFTFIKNLGINFIVSTNSFHTTAGKKVVEFFNKYGIGNFIYDERLVSHWRDGSEESYKEIEKIIDEFKNEPCYLGPYCQDEPSRELFDKIAVFHQKYDELKLGNTIPYVNLLPMAGEGALDHENSDCTYEEYLESYIEKVQPSYISFDCYPYGTGLDMRCRVNGNVYFKTLNMISSKAKKYKLPFWHFVSTGGQWSAPVVALENYPNEAQLNWNVNTGLAFGAKGISYFPLMQPYMFYQPCHNAEVSGIIGFDQKPNKWYAYVKSINNFINHNDKFFLDAEHLGCIFVGSTQQYPDFGGMIIQENSFENMNYCESNHGLIGLFRYNEKLTLYAVNNSYEDEGYFGFRFNEPHQFKITDKSGTREATEYELREKNCLLIDRIPKGGAVIIEII